MAYISNLADDLKYNQQQFPTVIVNDGSVKTLSQAKSWISTNLDSLKKELACTGAILFRGFPVDGAVSYDEFFSAFNYTNFTYKESLSNAVRINHTKNVFTANEAPRDVEIYLHNEMAQTPLYPQIISLFCEKAADIGGATAICRCDSFYEDLLAGDPEFTNKLEKLGVKYTTTMPAAESLTSAQGRSWRGTLSVESVEQAEKKLSDLGYSWHWNEDGSLKAQTCALPAIKTLDDGRKVFFNQLVAVYLGWKGAKENPARAICFGDDSEFSKKQLDTVVAISKSLSYDLEWQNGDVAIVNNSLAMHGRRPYSGDSKRNVFVVLGLE